MTKVNGKNKGSNYERKIANLLSERFRDQTGLESSFRRNPDSGSYFGGQNQKRTETHNLESAAFGDLICPKAFEFSIECKNYKTAPSFKSILLQDNPQLDKWLSQASQDAANSAKKMALVIKFNLVPDFVVLDHKPISINSPMIYKNFFIVTLIDWLTLPDHYFFTS